jgi:hypothetical protein
MGISDLEELSGRGFSGCQPLVAAVINVFAPGFRSESEILCQQIRKLSRGFT